MDNKFNNVSFINSEFKSNQNSTIGVIIQGQKLSFDNCTFNTPIDRVLLDYDTNNNNYEINNCKFEGGQLIAVKGTDNQSNLLIKNSKFNNTYIQIDSMRNLRFEDNDVFYSTARSVPYVINTSLQRIKLSKGNKFHTGLVALSDTEHFAVAYNFTRRVETDEYPARTFRPNYNPGLMLVTLV